MRGKPFIHWIVFSVLWLLLLYPLVLVTTGSSRKAEPVENDSGTVQTWVGIRFSSLPDQFELLQGDVSLWLENAPKALEYEQELSVTYSDVGFELMFAASLDDVVSAVEITVTPDGHAEQSETIWAKGQVREPISFSWEKP